ncbi:branched-chain amino acid transport system ATP-binding protein [Nocardioides sp. J9]|uniref:ABC transporter ATP-binding protein n=1 Tax=unclassified Nocardioides TaxID=2615069 RepID=UPI00048B5DB3|nr:MULTISPECIES: ABC transporter ATP-binding protein [unclassified Nocardioides]TWH00897.1 branched-chain amino acid transport system ATP-binding protein [Nocardioides sp. J9]
MTATPVLEFRDVTAGYGGSVILQDLSFSIAPGETVGLVGRNGAGKTTTLLSVYGVPSVRGQVLVDGEPVGRRAHVPTARGVSLVPQGKRIFGNLTVEENILLGRASRRATTWTLEDLYELFPNLARGRKRPGTSLSGGEQQMLAIARALMAGPALLMLDEPTEGLAPVIIDAIVDALREIRSRGTALLLVEQHIGMIQKVADRYLALRKGRLAGEGPIEQLGDRAVQEMIAL